MGKRYLEIANAQIIFRNFAGRERKFNPEGKRNFSVIIDKDDALKLQEEGWNIKQLNSRDPDDEPRYFLQVTVSYNYHPPKIMLISGNTMTELEEDNLSLLDDADIELADIVINPSHYEVNGKTGIKAYLKQAYFTLERSTFDKKYDMYNNSFDTATDALNDDEIPF